MSEKKPLVLQAKADGTINLGDLMKLWDEAFKPMLDEWEKSGLLKEVGEAVVQEIKADKSYMRFKINETKKKKKKKK
jgi:hypothetical protein